MRVVNLAPNALRFWCWGNALAFYKRGLFARFWITVNTGSVYDLAGSQDVTRHFGLANKGRSRLDRPALTEYPVNVLTERPARLRKLRGLTAEVDASAVRHF